MGEFVEFYANAESESESEDGNDLGVEDFEISDASDEEDEPPKKKTKFSTSKNFIKKKSQFRSKLHKYVDIKKLRQDWILQPKHVTNGQAKRRQGWMLQPKHVINGQAKRLRLADEEKQ